MVQSTIQHAWCMKEDQLLKRVVGEAVWFGRGHLIQKMGECVGKFGWQGVTVDIKSDMKRLSDCLKGMLMSAVWRRV